MFDPTPEELEQALALQEAQSGYLRQFRNGICTALDALTTGKLNEVKGFAAGIQMVTKAHERGGVSDEWVTEVRDFVAREQEQTR